MLERHDPLEHIANRLGEGGRCLFMPNGGNLGDCLIASATIQGFEKAGIPWAFIRGQRDSVRPADLLVFGGGGSLVSLYEGGIQCVASLLKLPAPVVVLPHTVNGHAAFWRAIEGVTVFCRDRQSLEFLDGFPGVRALSADDMAIGLDLTMDPFSTVKAIRDAIALGQEHRVLRAYRRDIESDGPLEDDTFDLPGLIHPPLNSTDSIHANTCAFLATLAGYSEIHTDRLHVAIAGSLLEIPVVLKDNSYGKNRAVYDLSLRHRFPRLQFIAR